jgi:hypothetical protein
MEQIMPTHFRFTQFFIFGLIVLLTGCSFSAPAAPTPFMDANAVATQVAILLTASPAVNNPQPLVITATLPPAPTGPAATGTSATGSVAASTTPQPPTSAPTQTPTASDTPQPTPTATAVAGDPRQSLGDPTFQDTKFKEDNNWGSAWKDDFTQGQFKNNELVLTSIGVDGWTLTWPKIADFYIEMTATTGDCSGMDRYGLIVRVPETFDRGYLFGFTCDGQYSLRVWDPVKKQYNYLVKWTHSEDIVSGSNQTNRVGLMAQGDKLSLYANGKLLSSATDSRFDKGRFGPFVGHADTNDFTVYIKEIAYWDLP